MKTIEIPVEILNEILYIAEEGMRVGNQAIHIEEKGYPYAAGYTYSALDSIAAVIKRIS